MKIKTIISENKTIEHNRATNKTNKVNLEWLTHETALKIAAENYSIQLDNYSIARHRSKPW